METFLVDTVPQLLQNISFSTFLSVFVAGLLTSVSPCILAIVPVIIGYIGGYGQASRFKGFSLSLFFVLGMSITFAVLGILAVSVRNIFGALGMVWYLVAGGISVFMGLNLLKIWRMKLPGLKAAPPRLGGFRGLYRRVVFRNCGLTLCHSCSGGYTCHCGLNGNVSLGGGLLFLWIGTWYALNLGGNLYRIIKKHKTFQKYSQIVNYFSGTVLVLVGLYFIYLAT